ncbi:Lrp/AsnC ligand binding domain-containing protein [Spirillospora sp. CA-142024]|uniref:Lrp/AsnC ligand binding domain-containing protein n=1 Tax=Spirillospora sp. CA-142024 TaxID=3240036 RepID=UPI003D8EECCE
MFRAQTVTDGGRVIAFDGGIVAAKEVYDGGDVIIFGTGTVGQISSGGRSLPAHATEPGLTQEAHVVAGSAALPVKVYTSTTTRLQDVTRRLYDIQGVSGTRATVVLETFFEGRASRMGQ